jgi:hypothetical protein
MDVPLSILPARFSIECECIAAAATCWAAYRGRNRAPNLIVASQNSKMSVIGSIDQRKHQLTHCRTGIHY